MLGYAVTEANAGAEFITSPGKISCQRQGKKMGHRQDVEMHCQLRPSKNPKGLLLWMQNNHCKTNHCPSVRTHLSILGKISHQVMLPDKEAFGILRFSAHTAE